MSYLSIIFVLSMALVFYVYFGYPLIVVFWGLLRRMSVKCDEDFKPYVSLLIAAYNEEDVIEQTVRNKLDLDYPDDRLEIIVISDCSDDQTNDIVARIDDPRVRLLVQQERMGKTSALNKAAEIATGEILVFSDANSIYEKCALRHLVSNFADNEVGYVTGHMIYTKGDSSIVGDGCSNFMKYENFIRRYETAIGSVVGVNGGIDAIRKELYIKMRNDQIPDFVLPLSVILSGHRVIYDNRAILQEHVLDEEGDESRMRYRVALRSLWAIADNKELLFKKGNMTFSFQLWSHKILRYFVPLFLVLALILNMMLVGQSTVYVLLLVGQLLFYLLAMIPAIGIEIPLVSFIAKPARYFLIVNFSFIRAAISFLKGDKIVVWTPRKG